MNHKLVQLEIRADVEVSVLIDDPPVVQYAVPLDVRRFTVTDDDDLPLAFSGDRNLYAAFVLNETGIDVPVSRSEIGDCDHTE